MTRIFICLAVALFIAFPSHGQKISQSKLTAINELIDISRIDAVLDVQINTSAREIMSLLYKQQFPKASQSFVEGLTQRMIDEFLASKGDYYWRTAAVYDKYFTYDEILKMIDWYSSPLGKKTIKIMPTLSVELSEAGKRWGEEVGRLVTEKLVNEIKKSKQTQD